MQIQIFQVDAFTDEVFGGNPAAVCPLEEWLPDEVLQDIAGENNLSETAFFVPQGEGFHLRWFTPVYEVDLCGHATLATAHVIFHHLGYDKDEITFASRSGYLKVSKIGQAYVMDFPADHIAEVNTPAQITEGIGIRPVKTFKGREDFLAIVEEQEQIENLSLNFFAIAELLEARGLIVSAPGREVDFVSRCFFPNAGIDEDPVTGSAHTTMVPYWTKALQKEELYAIQLSKRQGKIKCIYQGERVQLIGNAVTYLQGTIVF